MIPKEYDSEVAELKWYDEWEEAGVYEFNPDEKDNVFVIDTPPPYPTGNFHVGNALNWCYIDFIARYKRMKGFNVMFPQGWDCHGLPTEVKVEENKEITKSEVPRSNFRDYCEKFTTENIKEMKSTMKDLGFGIDWSMEYITMDPDYWKNTQKSFVKMYKKGDIYRKEHPVNWCPRCETAIAYAEVEYESRKSKLNYIDFILEEGNIQIATTRPELLPACVAVAYNPNDERYDDLDAEKVEIPIFGHKVDIIEDENVDPDFGTGAVMVCTFGDKQDVSWWREFNLPLRKTIDEKGRLTELAGEYAELEIEDARKRIIEHLKEENYIEKQCEIDQNVGLCWRCDTPIEIISEKQWFVKVDEEEILNKSKEIEWIPEHMYNRLENWAHKMEWDWCISRQRVFGTPIPVWYCNNCGETIVADEEEAPIIPTKKKPKTKCDCKDPDIIPEKDVLDTWMDSSISPLYITGWPNESFEDLYPVQLRPQGHDIIRTWAFYTILRSLSLTGQKPWDSILINGMVFGEDGNKMSKSLGNFVDPEEAIKKESADSFRLWAAIGGIPGSDIQFRWKDVRASTKFLRKIWNVLRFTLLNIDPDQIGKEPADLKVIDKWLLSKLNMTIKDVNKSFEEYRFDNAVKKIREFLWEDLADNYLEMVKWRLYRGEDYKAKYTLFKAIDSVIRMVSPFAPFFAEEANSYYSDELIHNKKFPEPIFYEDQEYIEKGELLTEIVSSLRNYKSEKGIPLNEEIKKLGIYDAPEFIKSSFEDIKNTVWADEMEVSTDAPDISRKIVGVEPDMSILGPEYKNESAIIAKKLENMESEEINENLREKHFNLELNDRTYKIPLTALDFKEKPFSEGKEVDIIEVEELMVVIPK